MAVLPRDVAPGIGLQVVNGAMVLEIKPRLADKGSAIAKFMSEPMFAGRNPVFLGDDVTDEDGFAAVNDMGGISIRVGNGASKARFRLADVDAVLAWIGALPEMLTAAARKDRS